MAKVSLDDLRKGAPVARTERTYQLCLRRDLMAEVDSLVQEHSSLQIAQAVQDDEKRPPRRKGEGGSPRAEEIRQRLTSLRDEIEDATGDLRLRAVTDGEWRRWVNEHPARKDSERDDQVAFGVCNADDLAVGLAPYVLSWNGDQLADGDWDRLFAPNMAGGDLKALVQLVVLMQEAADDPKWRLSGLPAAQTSNAADPSPEQ